MLKCYPYQANIPSELLCPICHDLLKVDLIFIISSKHFKVNHIKEKIRWKTNNLEKSSKLSGRGDDALLCGFCLRRVREKWNFGKRGKQGESLFLFSNLFWFIYKSEGNKVSCYFYLLIHFDLFTRWVKISIC